MKELGLDVPQATELAWRLRKRGIMVPQMCIRDSHSTLLCSV